MLSTVIEVVITIFSAIVGVLPIPDSFVQGLDGFFGFIIQLLSAASWIIPLDLLVLCFGLIWAVDNYKVIFKVVAWLIERIPLL